VNRQRHTRAGAGMSAAAFGATFSNPVRVETRAPAPAAVEFSAVTPDGRPCLVRVAGGDIVSVWVPRFERDGRAFASESIDKLGLTAREWMPWARREAARVAS
jgi:hypothetical protein